MICTRAEADRASLEIKPANRNALANILGLERQAENFTAS